MKTNTTTKSGILLTRLLSVFLLVAAILAQTLTPTLAGAAQITTRNLTLVANGSTGGSKPGGTVNHLFAFTLPAGSSVGSIQFKYCTTAADTGVLTCTMPTGVVTTSATLNSQSGAMGFTMVNTTNGAPYLTRSAATISSNTAVTYQLNTITNPTSTNGETFFVRIATFASNNATIIRLSTISFLRQNLDLLNHR